MHQGDVKKSDALFATGTLLHLHPIRIVQQEANQDRPEEDRRLAGIRSVFWNAIPDGIQHMQS